MDLSELYKAHPPHVILCPSTGEDERWIPSRLYGRPDVKAAIKVLRGNKMRSRQGLMNEFGAALQFFEGFGENWHALKDCLSHLDEWMPAEA